MIEEIKFNKAILLVGKLKHCLSQDKPFLRKKLWVSETYCHESKARRARDGDSALISREHTPVSVR